MSPRFTALWLAWLWAFCLVETAALVSKQRGDTLSEHVWHWFNITPASVYDYRLWVVVAFGGFLAWWVGGWKPMLVTAFLLWLLIHFLTGGRI